MYFIVLTQAELETSNDSGEHLREPLWLIVVVYLSHQRVKHRFQLHEDALDILLNKGRLLSENVWYAIYGQPWRFGRALGWAWWIVTWSSAARIATREGTVKRNFRNALVHLLYGNIFNFIWFIADMAQHSDTAVSVLVWEVHLNRL